MILLACRDSLDYAQTELERSFARYPVKLHVRLKRGDPNVLRVYNVQSLNGLLNRTYDIWFFGRACIRYLALELRGICAGPLLEHQGRLTKVAGRSRRVFCRADNRLLGTRMRSPHGVSNGGWTCAVEL
jgi:hypothetical protein